MTKTRIALALRVLVAVGWMAAIRPSLAQQSTTRPAADAWQQYRILTDRNIFLRNRLRPVYRPAPRVNYTPRPAPAAGYVLTGAVRGEREVLAFFENTATGEVLRVRTGGKVGAYTVGKITLDGVEVVAAAGRTESIPVGATLAIGTPTSRPSSSTTRTAVASPAARPTPRAEPPTSEPPLAGGDMAALLERMRKRRQQQLGQ